MANLTSNKKLHALIDYEDSYVQPLILAALDSRLPPNALTHIQSISDLPTPSTPSLQWRQYESLDLEHAAEETSTSLMNSYIIRKALIRKHYLSTTVSHWSAKKPDSCLKLHVKPSVEFELDYAEFLDDALVEAFELRESFEKNEEVEDASKKQWWILKPGMSDRGQGIRLFNSEEDLTAIFEEWEVESDDEDDEAAHSEEENENNDKEEDKGNGIITSQLRHFIAQPYIHPPLLIPAPFASANRKFHIRTYILAVGGLKVFVYKPMLALFAGGIYTAPWDSENPNEDLSSHLTNTCMQTGEREGSVHAYWTLPSSLPGLSQTWKEDVFVQIVKITGDLFEGAARGMMVHFQPLPNAFELFGVDFMVDAEGTPWLLEVNAFPDFAQTGKELDSLVQGLFEEVVDVAIKPFFGLSNDGDGGSEKMVKALDIDLGRR